MISIVLPIHNESSNLRELYGQLTAVLKKEKLEYELVCVNNGSTDESIVILLELRKKDHCVKIFDLSRNFGHQIAVTAGLKKAKGEAVIIMDADLQDPPQLIPELIAKWKEGSEIVYAIRKKREGESVLKKILCKVYYRLVRFLSDIDIPLDSGDFRLLSRVVVDYINVLPEKNRYIRGLTSWVGFKQTGIEYVRPARHSGETKYSFSKMMKLAWDGITSFSTKPLKIATYMGIFIAGIALIYMARVIYVRLFHDNVISGWASLMTVILFLGGVQLISIGIIGEYLGRTLEEVRNRPLYIIKKSYE